MISSQINVRHTRLTLNLARINRVADRFRALAVYLTANTERCAEDFLHRTLQLLGHALEPHLTGNLDDLIERDGLGVLNVLFLLSISRRLLERLDD